MSTLDLSTRHDLITNTFSREVDKAYRLTEDQLASFQRDGYVSGIRVLEDEQIETLREELRAMTDPKHPGNHLFHEYHSNESTDPSKVLFHALGAWRIAPAFHDLLWHPAWTVPASQLLNGSVRFWHDQLFCKPPKDGGVVAWHQDYSYWTRTKPMSHLTCWIGLDDSTEENGCLQYIPGSHEWPLLPITGLAGDMEAILGVLNEQQKLQFSKPVSVELKKGEATFHHPLLVHGSLENRSTQPRRAAVLNAFRDGVTSASDEPLLQGVPPIEPGKPIEGRFFPLVLEV